MSVRRCLTTKVLGYFVCFFLIFVITSDKLAISQTSFRNSFPFLENNKLAVLQGLDKVTARISTLYVRINENVHFGTLSINVRACFKTPPTEPPESIAFLEIHKIIGGKQVAKLFSGWMYSSSPALSALEHAVYDVWGVDCTNSLNSSGAKSE